MNWRSVARVARLTLPPDHRPAPAGERIITTFPSDATPGTACLFFRWPVRPATDVPAVRYEPTASGIRISHHLARIPDAPPDQLTAAPCLRIINDPPDLLRRAVAVAEMGWKPLLDARREYGIDPMRAFGEAEFIEKVVFRGWRNKRNGQKTHEQIRGLLFVCVQWQFWQESKATWPQRAADMQRQGFAFSADRLKKACARHLDLFV